MEAASIPVATPLESDIRAFANRLALGLAAGLIAVLIHGEAGRLSSQDLTWRALLGS